MPVREVGVEVGWGPAKLKGTWVPETAEREAAWELYVELVTRVAVVSLDPGQGVLREALSSLYSIFGVTREILRKYGPKVASAPGKPGQYRFGHVAIWMLNAGLRPVLTKWHPRLLHWEALLVDGTSVTKHEERWPEAPALRSDLEAARGLLLDYARILAEVCEAPALIDATDEILASRGIIMPRQP